MPKGTIYGKAGLLPVNKATAEALGWLEHEDRELGPPRIISDKPADNDFVEWVLCPTCNSEVTRKKLSKHLKNIHGESNPKISQSLTIIRKPKPDPKAEQLKHELISLDKRRRRYLSMTLEELESLWNRGVNELEEEDKSMVRAALRKLRGID